MGLFVQLKHAKDVGASTVGLTAKRRALSLDHIAQPFSLVLTNALISQIWEAAGLQEHLSRLPEGQAEQVALFTEVTQRLKAARPQAHIMETLRESFELITLDTTDLQSLAHLPNQQSVLGILPSPDYELADQQGQRLFISGDTFDAYLEQIRVCLGSFFTPQAITYRRNQNILTWNLGIITFRLPNIHTCLEVTRHALGSEVQSYHGLPDIRHHVQKDEFTVRGDIPEIQDREIKEQRDVCVYALQQNQIVAKEYNTTSTSLQSVPDYDVLEVSRLAKKLLLEWKVNKVYALFVKQKQGTVSLLDAYPVHEKIKEKPTVSAQEQRLGVTSELRDHIPHLEQAIRDDNHSGIREVIEKMKHMLHRLLE